MLQFCGTRGGLWFFNANISQGIGIVRSFLGGVYATLRGLIGGLYSGLFITQGQYDQGGGRVVKYCFGLTIIKGYRAIGYQRELALASNYSGRGLAQYVIFGQFGFCWGVVQRLWVTGLAYCQRSIGRASTQGNGLTIATYNFIGGLLCSIGI